MSLYDKTAGDGCPVELHQSGECLIRKQKILRAQEEACGFRAASPSGDPVERIDPRELHDAMQNAPHDGKDYRQARAALAFIRAALAKP